MSVGKKHFEEWKAKTYASEKAHSGDLWDSGHNVGLEVGLSFALEYSELVNAEYVSELERMLSRAIAYHYGELSSQADIRWAQDAKNLMPHIYGSDSEDDK